MAKKLDEIRNDYGRERLDVEDVHEDPLEQFKYWMDEALNAKLAEPNAMSLATVDEVGRPSVRMVLLRGYDERGFVFFTNYRSRKAQEIEANPNGALCFFWPELERQVRIEGLLERTSPDESDLYFKGRPPGSRLGAWASPQSEVIPDRDFLENLVEHWTAQFGGKEIPRPEFWGGYRLKPFAIEFWQGRENRLHDRVRYAREGEDRWGVERLAP